MSTYMLIIVTRRCNLPILRIITNKYDIANIKWERNNIDETDFS